MNLKNNEIDIRYFLDINSCRKEMREPFNFEDSTVVIDGFSALILPKQHQYEELDYNENDDLVKFFNKALKEMRESKNNSRLLPPNIKIPTPSECHVCRGTGIALIKKCDECRGIGEVFWETTRYEYNAECQKCFGKGEILIPGQGDDCSFCNGTKTVFTEKHPVFIGDFKMDAARLFPVMKMSNLRVAVSENKNALFFYGNNCMGLIMEMM